MPDWLRTLRLSPGPGDRLPRTTRTLWATSAALLAIGAVLALTLTTLGRDSTNRIRDGAFLEKAAARCVKAEENDIGPNRKPASGAAEATRIEALAVGWEQMVADLRNLPVSAQDQPKVDRWLGAWERWTSLGHAYANALRDKDQAAAKEALRRSQSPKRVINHFAYVNGINACVFN